MRMARRTYTDTFFQNKLGQFNGGWANNLNCVNAANRNPKFETTINDTKTSYTDKAASNFVCSIKT